MKMYNKRKAFTLIELLVAITIIWILSVGSVTVYTSQMQKARDSVRITDITQLQSGVEQYYQDKAVYPKWGKWWVNGEWTNFAVNTILPQLASDVKHGQDCNGSKCWYAYIVANSSGGITDWAYELSTAFENSWNLTSKADNEKDWWDDPNRMERWIELTRLDTKKDPGSSSKFWATHLEVNDETAKIAITRSGALGVVVAFSE